jgi:nicotinamidase-related amidase
MKSYSNLGGKMNCYITSKNLAIKTESWLKRIKKFNQHPMKLNSKKSALLVIDMQNFFLDRKSPTFTCGGLAILPNVKKLIASFRKAKRPVIYTVHIHHPRGFDEGIMGWWWEGSCIEGTKESEVYPEIAPWKNEKIIYKHRYSAFYNADLEIILRGLKIEDLVITGVMTNLCCESTTRDAYFRDYRVFFLADATGTVTEEMHLATLLNVAYGFAYVTKTEQIIKQIS